MTGRRRPTSLDVAAAAGVSQPTVSRALRGDTTVSKETRDRIMRSARALNYTLDRRAARLRSGSTGNLALVILTMPGQNRATINPLYFALLGAVGASASARGYNLLLSFQESDADFRTDFQQTREADGTIVVGSARNDAGWEAFRRAWTAGERIICWGAPDDALPTIRCDNRAGAALATGHLASRGRRRIAFVGPGWREQEAYRERRGGYHDALRRLGLSPIEAPEVDAPGREEQGYAAALALLKRAGDIDAIFAACDLLALGVLRALWEGGRDVPRDVALAGFDGIVTAGHASPGLTTVEQDTERAGVLLVEGLLDLIAGRSPDLPPVPMRLAVRDSSG